MKNHTETKHLRIIWTGDKHSGKTTAAKKLMCQLREEGLQVGGILAPSIYENGILVGFDILDIQNEGVVSFASLSDNPLNDSRFEFCNEGLRFGQNALSKIIENEFDFIIVDEFGPLEICGKGWRKQVDRLIENCDCPVMLITRTELVEIVKKIYKSTVWHTIKSDTSNSQIVSVKQLMG